MTFDLDRDLEHTLDAGPSGDHRVLSLVAIVPFAREKKRFSSYEKSARMT